MTNFIPIYKPYLDDSEKNALISAFDSTWISSRGKYIDLFEDSLSKYIGVNYVNLTSNGTVALHLALLALNIKAGDEVLLPDFCYVAAANAVKYVGATPVLVDSDEATWQIDVEDLENKISKKSKGIIVVHIYGNSENLSRINAIKEKYNLFLVEDCAEAIGTKYENMHVGTYGDISTFSFFGNKTITTGEGGAVATNSKKLHQKITKLKNQGLANQENYFHDVIGYNYRMTNLAASIGFEQLKKIQNILQLKKQIKKFYLNNIDNRFQFQKDTFLSDNSCWINCIICNSRYQRDSLRNYLRENNIETRSGFTPLSKLPMYEMLGFKNRIANKLSNRIICLPSYPSISDKDLKFVTTTINNFNG